MKRTIPIAFLMILVLMFTGCITSTSPTPGVLVGKVGESTDFNITVAPGFTEGIEWRLSELPLYTEVAEASDTETFTFTPVVYQADKSFILEVTETYNIGYPPSSMQGTMVMTWLISVKN